MNNKYRGKRKKNNDRTQGRDVKSGNNNRSPINDIGWYSRYPNLLVASGAFPYPYRPGMSLPLGDFAQTGSTSIGKRTENIPGVLSLFWAPSVGTSNVSTDPASVVAKEIYAKVRQKFSGSLEADAPDYVVYLMALDSMFSYIAWLKRLYRVLTVWTPMNYVLPDQVINAMGIGTNDANGLRENRTKLWQYINELVLQTRKFMCPAVMDIFNRHYWMSDNIYTDSNSINSQFYMFNLYSVYKFKMLKMADGTENLGPGLEMVRLPQFVVSNMGEAESVDVDVLYQFGLDMINRLVAWDECYTINGYLQRAYEGAPVFIVDELPADQPFSPVYVEEVLMQIENSRTVPNFRDFRSGNGDLSGFNITQNPLTNAVVSNPQYTTTGGFDTNGNPEDPTFSMDYNGWAIPPVLTIRSEQPTVADNTIASRLQAAVTVDVGTKSGDVNNYTVHIDCGTEVPLWWALVDRSSNVGSATMFDWIPQTPSLPVIESELDLVTVNNMVNQILRFITLDQFDWHPLVFVNMYRQAKGQTLSPNGLAVVGDLHNVTTISSEDLENLHKICIYSELNAFSA